MWIPQLPIHMHLKMSWKPSNLESQKGKGWGAVEASLEGGFCNNVDLLLLLTNLKTSFSYAVTEIYLSFC
jgi:hypothetical protein